jgi:type VI secretion system protein VasG
MRGNPYVELVHWIAQLVQSPDSDLSRIIRHYEIDPSRLATDITANLDRLPRGATSISDFSPHLENAIERSWTYSTLLFGESQVRTGHLLVGLLKIRELAGVLLGISREFAKVKVEDLCAHFHQLLADSPEATLAAADGTNFRSTEDGASSEATLAAGGKQEALAKFAVDLTEKARNGELDPILGRDEEIRQIIDILMRRRQNNPILTGEAGVGKTAVVEGFAQRIVKGDVPPALKDVSVRTLDLGLLQAGASMKGEFENRLKQVIEEVQSSPKPIILFIDEAHTLIGAGGSAGQGDAANLLKPALARGTLRTIAATTWAEYKKYFEKDPALTRRFQVIKVEEPSEEKTVLMIRGLVPVLEKHHRVHILDEALDAAARLSHRYIPSRQLPDKAVSLIDTACARVAISQHATPPQVEDCQRRITGLEAERDIISRETDLGLDHAERAHKIETSLAEERTRLLGLEDAWKKEKELVDKLLDRRLKLREAADAARKSTLPENASNGAAKPLAEGQTIPPCHPEPVEGPLISAGSGGAEPPLRKTTIDTAPSASTPFDRTAALTELHTIEAALATIQGEDPLILPAVDAAAVAAVVADWTGIPVGRMVKDEIQAVLNLADTLEKRIIGQRHALEAIARRIQTSRARLDNPNKPIGVFLLAGTSGVGKTETALALAESLYGGESNVITINMSEFQEAHTVSTLKGSPPGYVGYGEGGVLTEAVRRRPYSVVLLDEVEKAHGDVHELFFQVFDKGRMEDGEGRLIDFKNTIILLTTNVGSDLIMKLCKDPELTPEPEAIAKALRPDLLKVFPAALLGRLVVIPYYPLSDPMLKSIIHLQLDRIVKRVKENQDVDLTYNEDVVKLIASRCTEVESGGRMVDAILTQTLLPEISRSLLTRVMSGVPAQRIFTDVEHNEFVYKFE